MASASAKAGKQSQLSRKRSAKRASAARWAKFKMQQQLSSSSFRSAAKAAAAVPLMGAMATWTSLKSVAVINLRADVYRLDTFRRGLPAAAQQNLIVVDAVAGGDIASAGYSAMRNSILAGSLEKRQGATACVASHLRAANTLVRNNKFPAMIAEDDLPVQNSERLQVIIPDSSIVSIGHDAKTCEGRELVLVKADAENQQELCKAGAPSG